MGRTYNDNGKRFRFDPLKFYRAVQRTSERDDITIDKLRLRLGKVGHVSPDAVKNHLRNQSSKGFNEPSDIKTIKAYGKELLNDEFAFLISIDENQTNAESEVQILQKKTAESITPLDENTQAIREIYEMLYDILSLYETSESYNYIPDTKDMDGAWEYYEGMIDKIRKHSNSAFLGKRTTDAFIKLSNIIDETEIFVKSFSVPGVVERWREINPKINYFDCAFDLIEELGRESLEQTGAINMLAFVPTDRDFIMRDFYFYNKKLKNKAGNLQYSDERLFQDELLDTLTAIFEHDFWA